MRIRTIKPEWLHDERMQEIDDASRVLSVALLLLADDHGRGRAGIGFLTAQVWQGDMDRDLASASRKTRESLATLSRIGFVNLYEVRGQSYYAVANWKRHQRVDKPGKPVVPPPCDYADAIPQSTREDVASDSRESRESLASDSRGCRETLAPDLDQYQYQDRDQERSRATHTVDPEWVRVLSQVDAAWMRIRGCALGVEMAPGPNRRAAESLLSWARSAAGDDWESKIIQAAEGAARDEFAGKAKHPLALLAKSPGAYVEPPPEPAKPPPTIEDRVREMREHNARLPRQGT